MKIHYCWFGKKTKSPLILKCIASWSQYCPNAEIIEWNEENFDVNISRYTKEAYDAQKWAFVSDYCRYFVLYRYGGIYLDTDVELIRSLNDLPENFVGFEDSDYIASGLIRGACKGDWFCKLMLEEYDNDTFFLSDGSMNLRTVCQRETSLLCKYGLKANNTMQNVEGIIVFPTEYFCPLNSKTRRLNVTENTYSIHHYTASWCPEWTEYLTLVYERCNKYFPSALASLIARFICNLRFKGIKKTILKLLRNFFVFRKFY